MSIFPLYPGRNFLTFNTSLSIPGPNLYDIPAIGRYAKENGYPNSKASILIPDIEYIKKFASYDLGISEQLLSSSLNLNVAKLNSSIASLNNGNITDEKTGNEELDRSIESKRIFKNSFQNSNQEGMGFRALEKTVISSLFEQHKPYFEIAQFLIGSLVKVEDIIARLAPLTGAAINPALALAIKSRKPISNDGSYGSPKSLNFSNQNELKESLNELKTQLSKGLDVKLDRSGKSTIKDRRVGLTNSNSISNQSNSWSYDYFTVSTVYSTGEFKENTNYQYKYIDIESDPEPVVENSNLNVSQEEEDLRPNYLVLGIFDEDGNTIDPDSKIPFYDINQNGDIIESQSPFKIADWISSSDKWILNKSIDYPNAKSWVELSNELFVWVKNNERKTQKDSPGAGWKKLKYKDIINFNEPQNKYLEFRKNDPVISFQPDTIDDYKRYYRSKAENSLSKKNINGDDREQILSEIQKIYTDDKILEQLQNLISFSSLKKSYFNGVEQIDWSKFWTNTPPNISINDKLRKVFKPMRFNIGGKTVWIDPETDYDYKIIKVDTTNSINYESGTFSLSSNIKSFIKNELEIKVLNGDVRIPFSIDIKKNGNNFESYRNVRSYSLVNWNFESTRNEVVNQNSYEFEIWVNTENAPKEYKTNLDSTLSINGLAPFSIDSDGKKTHISPANNGYQLLDDGQEVYVENGKVTKFLIFRGSLNFSTFINGQKALPGFFRKNIIDFDINQYPSIDNKTKTYIQNTSLFKISSQNIFKFRAKLTDNKGGILDLTDISYSNLDKNKPLSLGRYGNGWRGGPVLDENKNPVLNDDGTPVVEPDNPQRIGYFKRSQLTELDTKTYFVIEAVKKSKKTTSNLSNNQDSNEFYFLPDALGIIPIIIDLAIELFSELFPSITQLINLIKNPASFLTTILTSKLSDNFLIFSQESIQLLTQTLPFLSSKVKNGEASPNQMREEVKKTQLSNYVYVDDSGDYKMVIDGTGLVGFLGLIFGLKLDSTNTLSPISPVFGFDKNNSQNSLSNLLKYGKVNNSKINGIDSNLNSGNSVTDDNKLNDINLSEKDKYDYDEISIQYSTGKFIEGIDYKYIYVNLEIEKLISEGDELVDQVGDNTGGDIDELNLALSKYDEALNLTIKEDPKNKSLIDLIKNKIDNLKNKINLISQPIFKLILGILKTPFSIILSVLQELLDILKGLLNPATIAPTVIELLSFKWFVKYFTPVGILNAAGIDFDPTKLAEWVAILKSGITKDDFPLADLSKFLNLSFGVKLPTYNTEQFSDLKFKPLRILLTFFCLIEKIINAFIMLIWSSLGITAIIPPPLIKLCKGDIDDSLDDDLLSDLTSNLFSNGLDVNDTTENENSNFIYEVRLPDGTIKKDLDKNNLQKFIESNSDLDFDLLGFENIE